MLDPKEMQSDFVAMAFDNEDEGTWLFSLSQGEDN